MSLPSLYQLVVRHNFGESCNVTLEYQGWKYGTQGELEFGAEETPINNVPVPDQQDQSSGDIDNSVNLFLGLHGKITVTGTTLTNQLDLWLVTKQNAGVSDTEGSRLLRTVPFAGENSKVFSFEA